MKSLRHRIVLDLTFNVPLTQREARQAVSILLDDSCIVGRLVGAWTPQTQINRIEAKEFSRVVRAFK